MRNQNKEYSTKALRKHQTDDCNGIPEPAKMQKELSRTRGTEYQVTSVTAYQRGAPVLDRRGKR